MTHIVTGTSHKQTQSSRSDNVWDREWHVTSEKSDGLGLINSSYKMKLPLFKLHTMKMYAGVDA
jgi:hypothetical protein